MTLAKHAQVAASIRTQIVNGTLRPGQPAPSGAALARATGYSALTCRKALQALVKGGVLAPGLSPNARPRAPMPMSTPDKQSAAKAKCTLSAALITRRRAAGLTQLEFAGAVGVSVTTIGHAEIGRLWQSRRFWEGADTALNAGGELLRMHESYRAAVIPPTDAAATDRSPAPELAPSPMACITIAWADGTTTTVYPPTGVSTCHIEVPEVRETSQDGTPRP